MKRKRIRVAVVDDDREIRQLIRAMLSNEGYETCEASDGVEAIQIIENESPNIVILDILMPHMNGIEVLRRVRQWSTVPVLALSALNEIPDKINCFKLGADDYMTKPFYTEELLERIKAIIKRAEFDESKPTPAPFKIGGLYFDFGKRLVMKGGNEISLSPLEYSLVKELATHAGKTLTHEYLLRTVWGPEYHSEKEYLHVYIGYLRSKIETDSKNPEYILTVPGIGYRFHNIKY